MEDDSGNAKSEVQFFWPLRGKYWIIALAEDYSFAMVGHSDRKSLWILARTTELSPDIYQKLVDIASLKRFDLNKLQKTPSCN